MPRHRRVKPLDKVDIDEPTPVSGRISWHIENTLIRFVKRIFNAIGDNIKSLLSFAFEETIDAIEDGLIEMTSPMLDQVLGMRSIPDWIKSPIRQARKGEDIAAAVILIPLAIALVIASVMALAAPLTRLIQYEVEEFIQSFRPDPNTLVQMERRGGMPQDELQDMLNELGVTPNLQGAYRELVRARLPIEQLGQATLRGLMNSGELSNEMIKRGYTDKDVQAFAEILKIIPGPSDLIRMAVREAWDDNVASKFGYDANFPAEFAESAEKIGLSTEWAQKFWRAHWELPGVREGFDMLHRRIIDKSELELLLRVRDIPSFWSERLIKLSYDPYTRVDVRRMYTAGVLTEKAVFDTYLDLGYDEEHANKLTEWTINEFGQEGRELTKSDALASYTDNVITLDEVNNLLDALGYDPYEIAVLVARADLKKQQRFEKEFVENVRVGYVGKRLNDTDVISKLNTLNPPSGFVEERLLIWRLQRERAITRPSKTDLQKLWLANIINDGQLKDEMLQKNYTNQYIEWYMAFWTQSSEA